MELGIAIATTLTRVDTHPDPYALLVYVNATIVFGRFGTGTGGRFLGNYA